MKRINESKKLVKEGAGAGYTVRIKDLKFGSIIDKKLIKGKERYDDYYECKVEILPGEYEVEAEDYYNDFFWQEHRFGERAFAKIDGGVATIVYSTNSYDEDEADDELHSELENRKMDIAFGYGWGWVHSDLPKDKPIESDHVDVEGREFYGSIDKIELNAPDLVDAVNSGHQSIYDRDEDEEEDVGEEYDESSESGSNDWRVFDYGEDFPYIERYTVLDPDGYQFFISHNGGVGMFPEDAIDEIDSDRISDILEVEIYGKTYRPSELDSDEISSNRIVQKGLNLIKVKYEDEDEEKEEIYESLGSKKNINLTFDEFNKLCDFIDMDWKRWNKSDKKNIDIVADKALEHLEWITSEKLKGEDPKDVSISFTIPSSLQDDFSTGSKKTMTIYELIEGMFWDKPSMNID